MSAILKVEFHYCLPCSTRPGKEVKNRTRFIFIGNGIEKERVSEQALQGRKVYVIINEMAIIERQGG